MNVLHGQEPDLIVSVAENGPIADTHDVKYTKAGFKLLSEEIRISYKMQ